MSSKDRGQKIRVEKEQEEVDAALWVSPNSKWVHLRCFPLMHCIIRFGALSGRTVLTNAVLYQKRLGISSPLGNFQTRAPFPPTEDR